MTRDQDRLASYEHCHKLDLALSLSLSPFFSFPVNMLQRTVIELHVNIALPRIAHELYRHTDSGCELSNNMFQIFLCVCLSQTCSVWIPKIETVRNCYAVRKK